MTANFLNSYFEFIDVSYIQFRDNLDSDKQNKCSPVKMFLSSRQAGYSKRQQRPKLQGPSRASGPCMLRGSRGMLARKVLKIFASNGCIWCILG